MLGEIEDVSRARRVAVLAAVGTLDHQPGVINAVKCFLDNGYKVEVFGIKNDHYVEPDLGAAKVRYLPWHLSHDKEPRLLLTVLYAMWLPFAMRGDYTAVFAGGVRALVAAWICSWFRRCRIINLQLELYIGPRLNVWYGRLFKFVERKAIRKSWLSLIHDENRAEMLVADAGIGRDRIEILPNSPLGPGQIMRSDFLHRRLGLADDVKVLLAPGSLHPSFMSAEIAAAAQDLPGGWKCVLHSAQPRRIDEPYIREILSKNQKERVVLSLDPVPYDQIDEVLSSAHIGLAIYGSVGGENAMEVGLASGKLCQFLKLGIPVIVSDYKVLREYVHARGVGVAISELAQMEDAISKIESDYSGYRQRALDAFSMDLAFEQHFRKVLDRLEHV